MRQSRYALWDWGVLRALNYFILRKMQNKHCSLSSAGLPFGEVRLCDAHTGPFSLDTGSSEIVLLKIVLAGGLQCWMHAALRHEAGAGSRTDLPQGHPTLHQHLSRLLYSDRNQRRDRIAKKECFQLRLENLIPHSASGGRNLSPALLLTQGLTK